MINAAAEVELNELVNLQPFVQAGVRPGQSLEEVEPKLGVPDAMTTDREGRDDVFRYYRESGTIDLVRQHVSSEGAEVDRWFIRFRPAAGVAVAHPDVLAHQPPRGGWTESILILAGPDRGSVAKLEFEDGELAYLWWLADGS